MTEVFGKNQGIARNSGHMAWRGLTDGAGVVVPWFQALILEGYGFTTQFGAADLEDTDPGTFGAGGVDLTEFDMLQTLPANGSVGIIPIYFKPILEAIGTIAAVDILLAYGSGGVIGANSVANTAKNLRPDSNIATACTIASLGDAAGTTLSMANGGYIWREGTTALTGASTNNAPMFGEWSAMKHGNAPVIVGASRQVAAYVSAQASTGYVHYQWIEMPNEYFD